MKTDSHHFEITEKCLLWHFMAKILFEFLPLFVGSDYGQVTYFYPLFIGSDMRQITFFYPFLLGQIWVKLHFYPFIFGQIRLHFFTIFIGADHGQITYFTPFHRVFLWFSYIVTLRKMLLQHFEKEANISHPWLLMSHGQVGVTQLTQILWTKD